MIIPVLNYYSCTRSNYMNEVDDNGNEINGEYDNSKVKIIFFGQGNKIIFKEKIKTKKLDIVCDGNNIYIEIGKSCIINGHIRISSDCKLIIGDNLLSQFSNGYYIGEGCSMTIGNDCMFSGGITFQTDDSHAIYDVITGNRINKGKDIIIGNHVWVCENCKILKNTTIRDGSIIGMNTLISNCTIMNNSIVAGCPFKYIRYNIAWEKPYVNSHKFSQNVIKSYYWKKTEFE